MYRRPAGNGRPAERFRYGPIIPEPLWDYKVRCERNLPVFSEFYRLEGPGIVRAARFGSGRGLMLVSGKPYRVAVQFI